MTPLEDTAPPLIAILSIHRKSTFLFLWELEEISLAFENEASFSFPHESAQPDLATVGRRKCYKTFRHGIIASWWMFPMSTTQFETIAWTPGLHDFILSEWLVRLVLKSLSMNFKKIGHEQKQTCCPLSFNVRKNSVSRPWRTGIVMKFGGFSSFFIFYIYWGGSYWVSLYIIILL